MKKKVLIAGTKYTEQKIEDVKKKLKKNGYRVSDIIVPKDIPAGLDVHGVEKYLRNSLCEIMYCLNHHNIDSNMKMCVNAARNVDMVIINDENVKMSTAMICQPMQGKSVEEILDIRQKAKKYLEENGYTYVDTYFEDGYSDEELKEQGVVNIPLFYLGESLKYMSKCKGVYFCKGWKNTRGCKIEHSAANAYGLDIIKD